VNLHFNPRGFALQFHRLCTSNLILCTSKDEVEGKEKHKELSSKAIEKYHRKREKLKYNLLGSRLISTGKR
jgi:hypothetical protein